jgi:hypothetical protein
VGGAWWHPAVFDGLLDSPSTPLRLCVSGRSYSSGTSYLVGVFNLEGLASEAGKGKGALVPGAIQRCLVAFWMSHALPYYSVYVVDRINAYIRPYFFFLDFTISSAQGGEYLVCPTTTRNKTKCFMKI